MLAAARRIAAGEVPYGDFWWFYPPGQPYLLAGLEALSGPSLLSWRIVRVLADAAVGVLAHRLAVRGGARPGGVPALAAWLASVLAMAYPSGPHPFPLALAFALGALLAAERRPALAGALCGLCAAWRIEFAAALAGGVALARLAGRPPAAGLGRFAAAAAGVAALIYLPVVLAAGPRSAWELLVDYPLTDFRDYQALPFPLRYDGPLNTGSVHGFLADSAEPLLLFFLPLVLVTGLAASLLGLALDPRRRRDPLVLATAVVALGMLAYLLVRADLFHTAPLAVLVSVLAAWAWEARPRGAWLRAAPALVAGAAVAFALVEGADRRWLALREDTVPLRVAVADGVRVAPAQARELEAVTAAVRRAAPPGAPLYVTGRRADFATAGAPLLYVLADRSNPTRYDIAAPGVVTSAPVQRAIVADLERTRTPVVVRWRSPLTAAPEPNAAGRSSGVRILDAYLAERYAPAAEAGSFSVLRRRPG